MHHPTHNDTFERDTISWVHPHLKLQEAGEKGMGTFVTAPIQKGEIVIVQGGRIIHGDMLDLPEYEPYGYHCFQVRREFYICPIELSRRSADGVFDVNHSCEPTCGFKGEITMVAMRDLVPGDEITFDYVMTDIGTLEEGWEDMPCLCGTATCRKTVTGRDWQIPALQDKYRGYFSPYVQDLIDAERGGGTH